MKKSKHTYKMPIIAGILIGLFSFTGDKPLKFFSFNATIYYHGSCEQYIGNNFNLFDCRDNGLSQLYAFSFTNWNSTPNTFTSSGDYIAQIQYNTYDFPTVAGLLAALSIYYWFHNNTLPSNGTIFSLLTDKSIMIYRTASTY